MFEKLSKLFGAGNKSPRTLIITAPVDGELIKISEVPDPVFADELLGPGVALKPANGHFKIPCAGELSVFFETGHAATITTPEGAEVLMHIGLETVNLKGAPFTKVLTQGDKVEVGDLLVEADLEAIVAAGCETVTPIVICNADDFENVTAAESGPVKQGDPILTITLKA